MSDRVSISSLAMSACSGLIYSGVPSRWLSSVNSVRSVNGWLMALATPKSMILGIALSPSVETRILDGLMSRWIMPFWCAWCTA